MEIDGTPGVAFEAEVLRVRSRPSEFLVNVIKSGHCFMRPNAQSSETLPDIMGRDGGVRKRIKRVDFPSPCYAARKGASA
jgi:hypothetical protein